MENSALYGIFSGQLILLGLALIRMSTAFLLLPLFSSQLIPPLIRNSIFVVLSLIMLSVHAPIDSSVLTGLSLIRVIAAEVFIGIALGVLFGLFLWAFEAAGEIVDTAIGSSIAMIFDPISGNEVTLIGEFLGRWINYLFMAAGGMLMITGVVLESFVLWPLGRPLPAIPLTSIGIFEAQFTRFFALTITIAAPLLVVIFLIDMSMGLINRFAQQLNVLFLSISIKALASLLLLIVLIPVLTTLFVESLNEHYASTLDYLKHIILAQ